MNNCAVIKIIFILSKRLTIVLFVLNSLFVLNQNSFSESPSPWRYFTSQDGLTESWVSSISVGSSGKLMINYGDVPEMTIYDGYLFHRISNPGIGLKVYENNVQQLWSVFPGSPGGFQQFVNGKWQRYTIDDIDIPTWKLAEKLPFVPYAPNKILYIYLDRLMVFDSYLKKSYVLKKANDTSLGKFIDCSLSREDGIWITGEHGAAKIQNNNKETRFTWHEYLIPNNFNVVDVCNPFEGNSGELFCVAKIISSKKKILLHFDGEKWDVPLTDMEEIIQAGWRGHDNSIWINHGSPWDNEETFGKGGLRNIRNNHEIAFENGKVLSGQINDVCAEKNGVFWVATANGLARFSPLLWRSPSLDIPQNCYYNSILEDQNNRIWFTCLDNLLMLVGEEWIAYPIPKEISIKGINLQEICAFPDGRIILAAVKGKLLTFNPSTVTFNLLAHPEGHYIVRQARKDADGIWLITLDDQNRWYLEKFDGHHSEIVINNIEKLNIGDIRTVYKTKNGNIWIGGNNGVILYRNGIFYSFGPDDGYYGGGSFCFLELDNGHIWVGGRDHIFEFDGTLWKLIRSAGLETIRSMVKTYDGSIWVASGSGIHRYNNGSWISQTNDDGLPDAAMLDIFQDSTKRIWTGSMKGLSLYHPDADLDDPETIIPTQSNANQIPYSGKVHLIFQGIDKWRYTKSENLLYSHRFDNNAWSSFHTDANISESNFKPGIHKFEVRAMDRNWNVDPTPALFEFTVLLPWYKEPLFIVFFVVSILLIAASLSYALHRYLWLNNVVDKRTHELQKEIKTREKLEKQFIQSQKMEAIGQLAGGVAHDFNNILMAISGNSEFILKRKDLDIELRDDVVEIQKSAARAAALTRQLLAFSRKQVLEPKILNLNDLIQNMIKMLYRLIGENINMNFIPDPLLNLIKTDPGQMEQIIMNLVVNARDAMPQGGSLVIETKNIDVDENYATDHDSVKSGPHVMLAISDTGQGMDKETQQRIFDPFYTTKEQGRGTGLG